MLARVNSSCSVSSQRQHLHAALSGAGPSPPCHPGQLAPRVSEGRVSGVMPVSQRCRLSFHSSSKSVFSGDPQNHLVNKKIKNCPFHLQMRNMKLGGK